MNNFFKHGRRLAWIEASLRFAGRFGIDEKKAYRHRFSLTDGMVSRDQDVFLRLVNERWGSDVVIKEHGRLWLADAAAFQAKPVFVPLPKMADWLEDALGSRFEMVTPIRRSEPSHAILREVVQAIVEQRPLRFRYQPRRAGKCVRLVSPHVIVHVAGRMHLRGWDHGRNAMRDFVVTRITDIGRAEAVQVYVGHEQDRDWAEQVVLEVRLRDGEELEGVRPDYNLDASGWRTKSVRKAHARYLVEVGTPEDGQVLRTPVTIRLQLDNRGKTSKSSD